MNDTISLYQYNSPSYLSIALNMGHDARVRNANDVVRIFSHQSRIEYE